MGFRLFKLRQNSFVLKSTIVVLLLLNFPTLFVSAANKELSNDIHQICQSSPSQCLDEIEANLASAPFKSRVWFQYKLYQLDAFYRLVKFKALNSELEKWLDIEKVPLRFQISIYILYAKVIQLEGREALGNEYLNKAVDTLISVNKVAPDPMLIVQIANALNDLKNYQQGYDMLIALEKKFVRRDNIKLKLELYENLGHFSYRLGKLNEHILFRVKANCWAKLHGNDQRIAITVYNLARAYQMTKEYSDALDYFVQAEYYANKSKNYFTLSMTMYRRAEIELDRGNYKKAMKYFHLIDVKPLPESFNKELDTLVNKIKNKI
jgi:tetratricopeptide (TPR) repeat protein